MNPHHAMMNAQPPMNPVSPMGMGSASVMQPSPMGGGAMAPSPQAPVMFRPHQPPQVQDQRPENLLHVSWNNRQWNPNMLNAGNILEYFANSTNPFYDRSCNNEHLKMQRLPMEHLSKMQGTEYAVLYSMEPLFVVRKLMRQSPTVATPLADFYIIGGTAYQAPDLGSVINFRVLSAMDSLKSAFDEVVLSTRKYHPSRGYYWEFKERSRKSTNPMKEAKQQEAKRRQQHERAVADQQQRSTAFQRVRVHALLGELIKKFPPPEPLEASSDVLTEPHNAAPS